MLPINLWNFFVWYPILSFVCRFLREPKSGDVYVAFDYQQKPMTEILVKPCSEGRPWGEWWTRSGGIIRPWPYGAWKWLDTGITP